MNAALAIVLVQLVCLCAQIQASILLFNPEKKFYSGTREIPVLSSKPIPSIIQDTKVYLFPGGGRKVPYNYVDDTGLLTGFDVDLVTQVCALVGKTCKTINLPFTECVFTYEDIDYAGRGLMSQWIDGCPGYATTIDRRNEFDFTLPYLLTEGSFSVLPGNPKGFDPGVDDYSAFTLVRLSGAPTNPTCLTRLKKKYGRFLIASSRPEAQAMLLNGTADVLFSPRQVIKGLDTLPVRVRCDDGGAAIMLRKGSDLPTWWNPAFQTFYFSGKYADFCAKSVQKYGRQAKCLPSPEEASPELLAMMSAAPPTPVRISFSHEALNKPGVILNMTQTSAIFVVCAIADKRCVLMLAQVAECTTRDGELLFPGRGLMEGWFDGCTGYFETVDRDNSWDFTSPYLVSNASFYVRPGNPSNFDPTLDDYSNFVLVHADTAITNDHCLNRLKKKFNVLLDVPTEYEAIQAVLNGTADAWFTKRKGETQLEELSPRFHCENVGTSIMAKKGSDLPGWWNAAFQQFFSSGQFTKFCQDKGKEYNLFFPPTRLDLMAHEDKSVMTLIRLKSRTTISMDMHQSVSGPASKAKPASCCM
ncbi:hypothetical protein PoB_000381300 [Plakobranchus ocellatus]|uniref:Solute-binding protein family 3/N-terminal domain-containing protein n=1 Tax=Plakobranchus ocellatus TaxID=259542 RepID=A0AAV3Y4J1_9GAST|nr:hypothetical protein PoB_000381300 [Plakobranchus ocellatus]